MQIDDNAEQFRTPHPLGLPQKKGDPFGWFVIPSPISPSRFLRVMVAPIDETEWQHVSVSCIEKRKPRTPVWSEMCFIKDMFWEPEEVVFQLHPKKSEYVNHAENCLHLWRYTKSELPTPEWWRVGPKN